MHEPLRHEVERSKAIADDGLQFAVEPRLHHLRQRITIEFVRLTNRHVAQNIVCVLDGWRVCAIRERLKQVALIRNFIWRINHQAARGFLAKIGEFFQHFGGCLKIERCLKRRVVEPVLREDNLAIDRVLRLQKVHVSRRHNRNAQPIAKGNNLAVDVQYALFRRLSFAYQKRVVAARLNL